MPRHVQDCACTVKAKWQGYPMQILKKVQYFASEYVLYSWCAVLKLVSPARHVHSCRFPVWIWVHDNLIFYGLPIHGIMGVKIAIDCGGAAVTADQRSFTPDKLNTEKTDEFVKKFFPKVSRGNIFLHVRAHVHSN